MAGGFLRQQAGLSFPGDEIREKYGREVPGFTPNPFFESIFRQLATSLNPQVQRRRTRRQFGGVADRYARGTQGSMDRLNEGLASRGLQDSGIGAGAQGELLQNQAFEQAQLPAMYQQQLQQKQQMARTEALSFLMQMLEEQRAQRGVSEGLAAAKRNRPTGFQQVLGDVNAVSGALGGIVGIGSGQRPDGGGGGGDGGSGNILTLLAGLGIL